MKMLISPSPLSRQTPYHTTVSLNSGRWFSNSNNNMNNGFMIGNKTNGNGIKVVAEDDVKPFASNGHKSVAPQQCLLVNSSNSPLHSVDVKDVPVVTGPNQTLPTTEIASFVSSPSPPQVKVERKLMVEAFSDKQQVLEGRAQLCLKRLKTLQSTEARKTLYGDLKFSLGQNFRKQEIDLSVDAVRTVCGDSLQTQEKASSLLEMPPDIRQSTNETLSQLVFDVKRALPALESEDATDLEEEDDDAYFSYKEAQSLTENNNSAPVPLPVSPKNVLEKTPAWRYEQERLSLAARDAYLRLQIAELDMKCRRLSERLKPQTTANTSSSQSDTSIITHACSSARTRPYIASSRKRRFYTIAEASQPRSSAVGGSTPSQTAQLTAHVVRLSPPVVGNTTSLSSCHCSCRSLSNPSFNPPSSLMSQSPISCISCQSQRRQTVVASQPDIDPETRLTLIDSAFHPKLSKLVGCDVLSSTTSFDRLDTAAACLLDHSYSAESIIAKPKPPIPVRKSTSPTESNASNSVRASGTPTKKDSSCHQPQPFSLLPQIPLPAHLQKSNKLPNAFFVDPATLETASRLRIRKPSAASSSASAVLNRSEDHVLSQPQHKHKNDGKKKLLLQQKRRLEQRKRLHLQHRKEQQRRKQQQQRKAKKLALSASSSRRSSIHTPGKSFGFSLSASMGANGGCCSGALSSSAPCSFPATPAPVAVGSGGFDIDNVVIPPPTPTALLAAAQALAESATVEIVTPTFRRLVVEPLRPTPRSKQPRLSAPIHSLSKEPQINNVNHNGPGSLSSPPEANNNGTGSLDDSSLSASRLQLSSTSDVFSSPSPLQHQALPLVFEDTDDIVYRRRHLPLEQQERARYLAIMQHTIAPRKIRDMAVNARPPSQNGKSKGLSRSCNEERLRRSSRVSATGSCGAAFIDPECKPFVFPLSDVVWKTICAEKAAFAQQNGS